MKLKLESGEHAMTVPSRRYLTIAELRSENERAYNAFMDFTEAQTMFWILSMGAAGDIHAEDYQMDTRVRWVPEIGLWQ